jgi:hypothetical protein
MNPRKLCAFYALGSGVSMMIAWGVFFATGSLFGIEPAGPGIGFHIAAELAAGATLCAAGAGALARAPWWPHAYFLGLGMMFYAVINSPGLYPGSRIMMAVFAGSFVFALVFAAVGVMAAGRKD